MARISAWKQIPVSPAGDRVLTDIADGILYAAPLGGASQVITVTRIDLATNTQLPDLVATAPVTYLRGIACLGTDLYFAGSDAYNLRLWRVPMLTMTPTMVFDSPLGNGGNGSWNVRVHGGKVYASQGGGTLGLFVEYDPASNAITSVPLPAGPCWHSRIQAVGGGVFILPPTNTNTRVFKVEM